MNITVNPEIEKREIENFQELERTVYRTVLKLGCEILEKTLEAMDEQLLDSHDVKRFRYKGFQKTCIKTLLGSVEFKRRVYLDNAAAEGPHCVHLLDEALTIPAALKTCLPICPIRRSRRKCGRICCPCSEPAKCPNERDTVTTTATPPHWLPLQAPGCVSCVELCYGAPATISDSIDSLSSTAALR